MNDKLVVSIYQIKAVTWWCLWSMACNPNWWLYLVGGQIFWKLCASPPLANSPITPPGVVCVVFVLETNAKHCDDAGSCSISFACQLAWSTTADDSTDFRCGSVSLAEGHWRIRRMETKKQTVSNEMNDYLPFCLLKKRRRRLVCVG